MKSLLVFVVLLLSAAGAGGAEKHWAFQPIVRPTVPHLTENWGDHNSIDRFALRRIGSDQLETFRQADRATLIRRVTQDLVGLPPTRDEVRSFVDDDQPAAYQRLVDRLLASPHYGEHWARPWLDLCHYADSDGYLTDQARPVAWRYRAWLVDALNDGMPFDQFTVQQLAGDLLPDATIKQKLATGLLRQTLSNREGGADPIEFRSKQVVDRASMVGEIWMGLTVGCAECHDHKYDDISQQEFFQLYAFMNSADEINIDAPLPSEQESYYAALPEYQSKRQELIAPIADKADELQRRWEQKLLYAHDNPGEDWVWDRQWELLGLVWGGGLGEGQLEGWEIVKLNSNKRSQIQKDRLFDYFLNVADTIDATKAKELKLVTLKADLEKLKSGLPVVTRAPVMMSHQNPRPTHIHNAGDFRDRGEEVQPATPGILPKMHGERRDRLSLAKWLVSSEHPLTARVAVNRMWQQFFGRGIVATAGDFGVRGASPTDPELLDWLAVEFVRRDWDVKSMHRLIVTSAWYRRANQPTVRLSAEQIRDSILAISGLWDTRIDGPSVKPPQPQSVSAQGYRNIWEPSQGGDQYRRSLYTWVQRTSPFAMHITFDAPNPNHICTKRDRSNTPLQALTLLNDPFVYASAEALVERLFDQIDADDQQRLIHVFQVCLARNPNPEEMETLSDLLRQLRQDLDLSGHEPVNLSAADRLVWSSLCSVLFNLHEFVTRN